jgi:hypothetical protein
MIWGTEKSIFLLEVQKGCTLISGFSFDVDIICGILGNYTASCGNYLPTFRDNLSVPSSRIKIPRRKGCTLGQERVGSHKGFHLPGRDAT